MDDLETLLPRVRSKISIDPSGCWLWTASVNHGGYGQLGMGPHGVVMAHRYVYQQLVGPVRDGGYLCHTCDVPRCVNPAHLYVGDARTNGRDAVDRGLLVNKRQTHCKRGHELPDISLPHDQRWCRTCERLRREWRTAA